MTSHVDQKGIEDGKETLEKSDLFLILVSPKSIAL